MVWAGETFYSEIFNQNLLRAAFATFWCARLGPGATSQNPHTLYTITTVEELTPHALFCTFILSLQSLPKQAATQYINILTPNILYNMSQLWRN